jgi:hypothetical protein
VVHYRVAEQGRVATSSGLVTEQPVSESPAERAHRLTEKLRGLLREELAEYGGAEGFIRWVRSDDEEDAA